MQPETESWREVKLILVVRDLFLRPVFLMVEEPEEVLVAKWYPCSPG